MSKLSTSKKDFELFCVSKGYVFFTWGWLRKFHFDKSSSDTTVATINGCVKSSPTSFSFDEVRAAETDQYTCAQLMQACQETYGSGYNNIYSKPADDFFKTWYSVIDLNGEHCPHSLSLLTTFKFSEDF